MNSHGAASCHLPLLVLFCPIKTKTTDIDAHSSFHTCRVDRQEKVRIVSQLNFNMLLLNICICAGLMLSLPQCTCQSCTDGRPKQCRDADIAPGTNLAGEGFDITKMERKGAFVLDMNHWQRHDNTCTLCTNPYVANKKQKLPLSVVDWRSKHSCSAKVATSLHRSSESLVTSSTSSIENDWKVDLDLRNRSKDFFFMLAGSNSKLAEYSMNKTKKDKFSFSTQSMSCEYYSYRVSRTPRLHREFENALTRLPGTYCPGNKQQFYKLINDFGTHYITKVKLGGSVQSVTSIRECQASLEGLSANEVDMCLGVEAAATCKATISTETKHCKKDIEKTDNKSFSSLFNDRFTQITGGHTTEPDLLFSSEKNPSAYKEWLKTLPLNPDIISYSLDSLHDLLPVDSPAHKNLKSAIRDYILEKGLLRNCSNRCQVGIRTDLKDPCVCQCHNNPAVTPDCCPTRRGMARVIITAKRATGLCGDWFTSTDGYVKVLFNNDKERRTPVIKNNNNPCWNMIFDLGSQDLSAGNKVRFEVWDQDSRWDDDKLGGCDQSLFSGVKEDVCNLKRGQFFFKVEVICAPSLNGQLCKDYKPSPMSQSLQKLYVSRHAHPIPKEMLLEMGVFVNGTSSQRKMSLASVRKKFDMF